VPDMTIIGLTGGIGSGKSTVARFLAELGAAVIDADRIGHELYKPGTEVWQEVVAAFGRDIVASDGTIDRARLGEIVFSNEKARKRLNRIMHPKIHEAITNRIKQYKEKGGKVVVLEAPLLLEAGWSSLVDEVWATTASEATVIRRLRERAGLSESEVRARIRSQLPAEESTRQADVVIDTECSLDELKAKVHELWQKLQEEA
jgi:dephospho-CoA kinase